MARIIARARSAPCASPFGLPLRPFSLATKGRLLQSGRLGTGMARVGGGVESLCLPTSIVAGPGAALLAPVPRRMFALTRQKSTLFQWLVVPLWVPTGKDSVPTDSGLSVRVLLDPAARLELDARWVNS